MILFDQSCISQSKQRKDQETLHYLVVPQHILQRKAGAELGGKRGQVPSISPQNSYINYNTLTRFAHDNFFLYRLCINKKASLLLIKSNRMSINLCKYIAHFHLFFNKNKVQWPHLKLTILSFLRVSKLLTNIMYLYTIFLTTNFTIVRVILYTIFLIINFTIVELSIFIQAQTWLDVFENLRRKLI